MSKFTNGEIKDFKSIFNYKTDPTHTQAHTSQTCCSHVLACSDWLKAHKGDLHGQDQTNDVEGAVRCRGRGTIEVGWGSWGKT